MRSACDEIYARLRKAYAINMERFVISSADPGNFFEFLVAVVLSQNTSDANASKALARLKARLGRITPEGLVSLPEEEVAELIRPAGMHVRRARVLRELARALSGGSGEALASKLRSMPPERAREALMELPGVGKKTADVVLLMFFNMPRFPVDTHIARVTERLGMARSRNYDEVSRAWSSCLSPEHFFEAHILLIEHGRTTCRARRPLCDACVLRDLCAYGGGLGKGKAVEKAGE
ncbi:MAG: endonuclease III [Desulfurococcaceae archaeon]